MRLCPKLGDRTVRLWICCGQHRMGRVGPIYLYRGSVVSVPSSALIGPLRGGAPGPPDPPAVPAMSRASRALCELFDDFVDLRDGHRLTCRRQQNSRPLSGSPGCGVGRGFYARYGHPGQYRGGCRAQGGVADVLVNLLSKISPAICSRSTNSQLSMCPHNVQPGRLARELPTLSGAQR